MGAHRRRVPDAIGSRDDERTRATTRREDLATRGSRWRARARVDVCRRAGRRGRGKERNIFWARARQSAVEGADDDEDDDGGGDRARATSSRGVVARWRRGRRAVETRARDADDDDDGNAGGNAGKRWSSQRCAGGASTIVRGDVVVDEFRAWVDVDATARAVSTVALARRREVWAETADAAADGDEPPPNTRFRGRIACVCCRNWNTRAPSVFQRALDCLSRIKVYAWVEVLPDALFPSAGAGRLLDDDLERRG